MTPNLFSPAPTQRPSALVSSSILLTLNTRPDAILMNGALPLLRTLEPTVRKSCSRIPHITAHILHRRARSTIAPKRQPIRDVQATKLKSTCSVNHASTIAFNGTQDVQTEQDTSSKSKGWWQPSDTKAISGTEASQQGSGYSTITITTMQGVIDEGHPERVLHALRHPSIGGPFIRSASDQDFLYAFDLLDPSYFLDERKKIDRAIHPKLYIRFRVRKAGYLGEKFDWYLECIEDIISQRRQSGHPLTLGAYRNLLRWAEAMGAESLARDVFDNAMPQDGILPDLPSYNSYLGACVWNGAYDIDFRYRRRNAGQNFALRERVLVPKDVPEILQLRRPRYERLPGETIRGHALSVFGELTKRGHKPNEATFVNLILAMGYNSDMIGVRSVMKSVWNIDVDMLSKYDEEEIESPTFYKEDDPLRPSASLLHAIVYVFGTNNDPFNASYLLDYVSRNYNLQVPEDIWMLVYELTYVLAQTFTPRREQLGHAVGRLPEDALARLGETITDEPHNVKMNAWMLAKLANNTRSARGDFDATLEVFRQALILRDEQMTLVSRLYDDMLATCPQLHLEVGDIPSTEFLNKRRTFLHESLKLDRDLEALRSEMRNILQKPWNFNISPWHSDQWSVRTIPDLVLEFSTFLPEKVRVQGPTFEYIMEGKWHRERAITDAHGQFDVKAARLRNVLEEEETGALVHKARYAKKFIDMTERACFVCKKVGEHKSEDCPRWEVGLAYGLQYGVEDVRFAGDPTAAGPDAQAPDQIWGSALPMDREESAPWCGRRVVNRNILNTGKRDVWEYL